MAEQCHQIGIINDDRARIQNKKTDQFNLISPDTVLTIDYNG